ncbi:MAG: hypothetical protein C4287_10080 [Leptolyngbya sp. ERB_1_2]
MGDYHRYKSANLDFQFLKLPYHSQPKGLITLFAQKRLGLISMSKDCIRCSVSAPGLRANLFLQKEQG